MNIDYMQEYKTYIEQHKIGKTYSYSDIIHKHHVIPKSLGGKDSDENIVELYPKDHAKAHELLCKAYLQQAICMAHTVCSMLGKDVADIDIISLDQLKEYELKVSDVAKHMKKRTVLDAKTLDKVRICAIDPLPIGHIEEPVKTKNYCLIYRKDAISLGCRRWGLGCPLPADNWCYVTDADDNTKHMLFKRTSNKSRKGKYRVVHDVQTNKNKYIGKDQKLPDGYAEGMWFSEDAKKRQLAGSMNSKKIAQSKPKQRCIHNVMTHKNKLIAKTDPLPDGYAEGMWLSDVSRQKIKAAAIMARHMSRHNVE